MKKDKRRWWEKKKEKTSPLLLSFFLYKLLEKIMKDGRDGDDEDEVWRSSTKSSARFWFANPSSTRLRGLAQRLKNAFWLFAAAADIALVSSLLAAVCSADSTRLVSSRIEEEYNDEVISQREMTSNRHINRQMDGQTDGQTYPRYKLTARQKQMDPKGRIDVMQHKLMGSRAK